MPISLFRKYNGKTSSKNSKFNSASTRSRGGSVSVFCVGVGFRFLVGFYKSRFGIRYRFLKISDIGSVFRLSNHVYNYIPLIL